VKRLSIALCALLLWVSLPASPAQAISIGQSCAKAKLGKRITATVKINNTSKKKKLVLVCRRRSGRKVWIRAAIQTPVTTTTTTTTTVPEPVTLYNVTEDALDPTLRIIAIDGMQPRSFFLNVPASYTPGTPTPLLLAFHSRTTTGKEIMTSSQILSWAAAMNIIVVAVNGAVHEGFSSWNAGRCCTNATTYEENDVLLASTIIDYLKSQATIDSSRVWAMGHSNGGMMAYRLACDLSDKITAVAVVTGALMDDTCNPTKPVSVIHLHGNLDPTVPFHGGGKFETPSIYHSMFEFAKVNGCSNSPNEYVSPIKETYQWICSSGYEALLINFQEESHGWADGYTETVISFLFAHPRK
jgi:polyhydroxybutyrate depolymerase